MTPAEFHFRIVCLAKERKIPISRLEMMAGFPLGTIKQWKKAFPAGDRIAIVADCFNVSMDYLFLRSGDMTIHKKNSFSKATHKLIHFSESNAVSDKVAMIMIKVGEALLNED